MPSPEELLAQAVEGYAQYLEIANLSQIAAPDAPAESDVVAPPVPLGLVLWSSS